MIQLPGSYVRILEPVSGLDYFDIQTAALPRSITPLDAWNTIMAQPQPFLKLAFRIRDAISTLFGVKAINGFSGEPAKAANVGDHLDFFLVEYTDEHTLVLTERDRHLDVMTCVSVEGPALSITSSVKVHNLFGRLYMIPVGIAHKWIVRGMLKRLRQQMAA